MQNQHQILIIGGGTAGIMVASQLLKKRKDLDVAIIEPADTHYYQPAWTLVGAGTYDYEDTARSMSSIIPKGAIWYKEYAERFDPENNKVFTKEGTELSYEFLVVAPGLVMAPELIEGLPEALDKGVVCSNYTDPEHTWDVIKNFKGGNALFTQPTTPIKCGGAPQKIAYMAADHFRKRGILDKTQVVYATPGTVIFGIKPVADTLNEVLDRYDMHFKPYYAPVHIDGKNREVTFEYKAPEEKAIGIKEGNTLGEVELPDGRRKMKFDMLHLAPPQQAPKFIRESNLVNESGWLAVHKGNLQHDTYKNIFGIGDAAGLPTAKTGAAIRKQAPIVVENLLRLSDHKTLWEKEYNGYSSCPIVTGYGKMVLAEFDYDGNFTPDPKLKQMLIFDSAKEHWRLWMLKKYILPKLYWDKMMKGVDV
ncbi:MAG: NAD(P)/FAD-dependent oxidoreductase [Flavobacteriales bacterium]|nr:NAD(P)/FAD-dependent oxidoreductase [Flavobacteriales bacterium]